MLQLKFYQVDACLSGNQQVNNGSNGHCYGAVHYLESNTLVFTVSLHVPLVTHAQSNWLIYKINNAHLLPCTPLKRFCITAGSCG